MSAGSGPTWREPFATYDRASCSWRTSQPSLFEDLLASPPTWPKSGTWDLGAAYEHPTSAPPTVGNGCSSSPGLLPTPRPQVNGGGAAAEDPPNRQGGPNLMTVVSLLKTPTAQLAVNGGSQHPDKRREGGHGPTLADQVEHLLPTPRAADGTKGRPNQRGSSGDLMLPSAVMDLLPTPAARDWKSGQSNIMDRNARPLNEVVEMLLPTPTAQAAKHAELAPSETRPFDDSNLWVVATRIGERTAPRLHAGKPFSDGQHPRQLSLDELGSD